MPIYRDKAGGCFRFEFDRRIGGQRVRATKSLPRSWNRAQADAFDRQESARLYAVAQGIGGASHSIEDCVTLYLTHRVPDLKHGHGVAQELHAMLPEYMGRPLSALPDLVTKAWAWEPVHDLALWYVQSPSFQPDLLRCMGHAPTGPDDADYLTRSPRGTLPATRADFVITVGALDTTVPASHGRNAAAQIRAACPACKVTLVERDLPHQFWDSLSTLQAML